MLLKRCTIWQSLGILAAVSTSLTLAKEELVPFKYDLLPIGEVRPRGWIQDQLRLEGNGLAGHLFDFYRFVKDTKYLGGSTEYSIMDEASPYWYNGLVPLAFVLDDERLKTQVNYYVDYIMDHQQADGWIGFETTQKTRGIWGRCLILQGMMNHAIADPTRTERIVDSMHKFVNLTHAMLANNFTGWIQHENDTFDSGGFAISRAHELSTTLQWLYVAYPNGNEDLIWETMNFMWEASIITDRDWLHFFTEAVFPKLGSEDPSTVVYEGLMHGVNLAEGIRFPGQLYRMTRNESLVVMTRNAVDWVELYHGTMSGSIIADEYVMGQDPTHGSELCITVEMMFSLAYLYRLFGDNKDADHAELAAFNALPGGLMDDWWSHNYVTQTNQPWARNFTETEPNVPFYNVDVYGNVYGLEPNYPCCTVNHPQGLPKFFASSWVTKGRTGLVHMFLVPSSVSTTINGGKVDITCDTWYPFGDNLKYTVEATSPFDLYIRVPDWATSNSTISVNSKMSSFQGNPDGLYLVSVAAGKSSIYVEISTEIRVVLKPTRQQNTPAIYRGNLLYALEIEAVITSHQPLNYYPYPNTVPLGNSTTDPQNRALDNTIVPRNLSSWAVAIDTTQMVFHKEGNTSKALPNPVYAPGAPPVYINIAAHSIDWPIVHDTAGQPPTDPVLLGTPFAAKLVPFGSAKIHMAQLPDLSLGKVTGL